MAVDFVLNLTWLPVRVHMTYGFRSAKEVFTSQCEFFLLALPEATCLLTDDTQIMAPVHRQDGTGCFVCKPCILSHV